MVTLASPSGFRKKYPRMNGVLHKMVPKKGGGAIILA